jgi:hypothetical protein
MNKLLLPSLATLLLGTAPVFADEDTDLKEGETPQQRDDRLASQAGHYAAGLKVMFASAGDDSFNFIGVTPWGRYNVSDSINVGARIPLAVSTPGEDVFAVFGGLMARAEIRLGATVGAFGEAGFLKHAAVLLSEQDAPGYADVADYDFATRLGVYVRVKGGPTYLSFDPAFVYQPGDPEAVTGIQFPVTALFRAGSVAHAGAQVGIYTGDDFKLGNADGGRVAAGLVADVAISKIKLMFGAGFSNLLASDDMGAPYQSIGKSVYVSVNLAYVK